MPEIFEELDPNVFKIAAPIGMSLPFLNNS